MYDILQLVTCAIKTKLHNLDKISGGLFTWCPDARYHGDYPEMFYKDDDKAPFNS